VIKLKSNLLSSIGRFNLDNILNNIKVYCELINGKLNDYIPEMNVPEKKIYEAMRYSLMIGGKRIRPILALAVNDMFDGKVEDVLPFACAIEMIHTYSLIHDDLPAMDNDDYRRGRLTSHKVYGEGIAVLTGDSLLNKAFEIMTASLGEEKCLARKIKAMQEIASASGPEGMIGGQVVDIKSEGKSIDQDTLTYMHAKKTGRLIVASAVTGTIIAGACDHDIAKIYNYASNLGLAFQIKDDILAEIGDQEKLGKRVGNDRDKNKSTYVTILGLDEAKRLLDLTTQRAIESVEGYGDKAEFLIELAKYLLKREK